MSEPTFATSAAQILVRSFIVSCEEIEGNGEMFGRCLRFHKKINVRLTGVSPQPFTTRG